MELEHLVIREVPQSPNLSSAAGADAPSLCAFLMTLKEVGPRGQSGDIRHDVMPLEHHHADAKAPTGGVPRLTVLDQSPNYRANLLREGVGRLQAW